MKIGNPADKPVPPVVTNGTPAANGNAQAASAPAIPEAAGASATIELSNTASTLLSGASTPEFDAAKVQRITDAIDGDTFKINPTAIADKLIANAQELLSKVRP
jgi:negative regulator of flagellin synthesis FlgM